MSVRVLVVDDESLSRRAVIRFLRAHPDIQVIGECGDGPSAVSAILSDAPGVVFLDVQMPEMDGFEVIRRIGPERMPAVIFVTAYDRYALDAFDANAIDYLLKPFGQERFERALARAMGWMAAAPDRAALRRLLAPTADSFVERLPVSQNGRILFVKADEIDWIESAGNYARLHAGKRIHEIRQTLTCLERKLNPKLFVRVHRSAIINISRIKEVHPWFHGYHLVLLETGQEIRMSRYQRETAERLGLRPPRSR